MQYFFITALLEIQCLHNNVLFFSFLILWMRLILKSLEAISFQCYADWSNNSCLYALDCT